MFRGCVTHAGVVRGRKNPGYLGFAARLETRAQIRSCSVECGLMQPAGISGTTRFSAWMEARTMPSSVRRSRKDRIRSRAVADIPCLRYRGRRPTACGWLALRRGCGSTSGDSGRSRAVGAGAGQAGRLEPYRRRQYRARHDAWNRHRRSARESARGVAGVARVWTRADGAAQATDHTPGCVNGTGKRDVARGWSGHSAMRPCLT